MRKSWPKHTDKLLAKLERKGYSTNRFTLGKPLMGLIEGKSVFVRQSDDVFRAIGPDNRTVYSSYQFWDEHLKQALEEGWFLPITVKRRGW